MFTEENTNFSYTLEELEEMNRELKEWCDAWEIPFNENDCITAAEATDYKYLESKVMAIMDKKKNQQIIIDMHQTE